MVEAGRTKEGLAHFIQEQLNPQTSEEPELYCCVLNKHATTSQTLLDGVFLQLTRVRATYQGKSKHSTPKAIAWAIPNVGTRFIHSGLKWMSQHIFPPRYILGVFPSSSGRRISGGVFGYVAGSYR